MTSRRRFAWRRTDGGGPRPAWSAGRGPGRATSAGNAPDLITAYPRQVGSCPDDRDRVELIARRARSLDLTIAIAESLTSGRISALLGSGTDASQWFRGAVVAYAEEVKFDVLGVTPGPVVTDTCARQMAVGVRRVLGADLGVGVTGVGGPGSEEGRPAGTVHLAVANSRGPRSTEVHLPGGPQEVVAAVTTLVLDELIHELDADLPQSGRCSSRP